MFPTSPHVRHDFMEFLDIVLQSLVSCLNQCLVFRLDIEYITIP